MSILRARLNIERELNLFWLKIGCEMSRRTLPTQGALQSALDGSAFEEIGDVVSDDIPDPRSHWRILPRVSCRT
jgi:hypothetical protein